MEKYTIIAYDDAYPFPGLEFRNIYVTFDKKIPPHTLISYTKYGEYLLTGDDGPVETHDGWLHKLQYVNNDPNKWYPTDKLCEGVVFMDQKDWYDG